MRKLALASMLLAIFVIVACQKSTPPVLHELQLTESAHRKTYEIYKGSCINVTLKGNPTTGFIWLLLPKTDNQLILKADSDYSFKTAEPTLCGAGGQFTFKFIAANPGKAKLEFGYQRPWESKQPVKTFAVTIKVKDAR